MREIVAMLGPWSKTNLPFEWDKVSLGPKRPKISEWDSKTYFKPPLNETLSHSNDKVVFDHGPWAG